MAKLWVYLFRILQGLEIETMTLKKVIIALTSWIMLDLVRCIFVFIVSTFIIYLIYIVGRCEAVWWKGVLC